jgi:heptosyltransferase-1
LKILIVKLSSLGDVVHALPVLRMLKRQRPGSEIFWWIESSLAPLLEGDPDLSGLFLFQRKGWPRPDWWKAAGSTLRAVREQRFDFVLDLQGLSRSALFAWLANGQTTIGLDNAREGNREGAQIFYDVLAPRSPPGTLAPERYLSVLKVLGMKPDWNFEWFPDRPQAAALVRQQICIRQGRWVMLLPGARWDNKRWPVEFFAQVVRQLAEENKDLNFAILGSGADRPLAENISRSKPDRCLDLTGRTSLPEMVEWLRCADLVIANDTGPLHVAAALGRPVVAIYGPSDPLHTGPHLQSAGVLQANHLPCVPCMKRICSYHEPLACLRSITPEQVCARARVALFGDLEVAAC